MVFLATEPGLRACYRAWAEQMGPLVDGRVAAPATADHELGGPPRPVPTVLVAAGHAVSDALDICRRSAHPPDRLIFAPFPAAPEPAGAGGQEPLGALLVILACEPADGADLDWLTGWRRATTGPAVVRVFGTDPAGLLAPRSPVVPALMEMFRINPRWFATP
jgi:hypothetical protein